MKRVSKKLGREARRAGHQISDGASRVAPRVEAEVERGADRVEKEAQRGVENVHEAASIAALHPARESEMLRQSALALATIESSASDSRSRSPGTKLAQ